MSGKVLFGSWEQGQFCGQGYCLTPMSNINSNSSDQLIVQKGIWKEGSMVEEIYVQTESLEWLKTIEVVNRKIDEATLLLNQVS